MKCFLILISIKGHIFATTYSSGTGYQASTAAIIAGVNDQEIIKVKIVAGGGGALLYRCRIDFTMANTNNSDISNAKLYYTATTDAFSTTTLLGTVPNPTGTISFTFSHSSNAGSFYYWLAYDIKSTSTNCDVFDAVVAAIYTGASCPGTSQTITTPNPAGFRTQEAIGCWTYCTPSGNLNCTSNDFISNVSINTLNNTSTCSAGGYIIYAATGAQTTTVQKGFYYSLSLSVGAGTGNHGAGVWIDFNNDADFTDNNEFFLVSNSIAPSTTKSVTIFVPTGAVVANTRMRVRYAYNLSVDQSVGCTMPGTYGETEDYTITIADGVPHCLNSILDADETGIDCGGVDCFSPNSGTASANPASTTCGSSVSLSSSGAVGQFQWQKYVNGSWTDIVGANSSDFSLVVRSTSQYRLIASGGTCTSTSNTVTVTITDGGDMTWVGTTSAWATPGNWSPAGPPSACNNVIIPTTPTGGNFPIIPAGGGNCNNLTIQNGATITNNSSTTALKVYGDFFNYGNFNDAGSSLFTMLQGPAPSFFGGSGTFLNGGTIVGSFRIVASASSYIADYTLSSNVSLKTMSAYGACLNPPFCTSNVTGKLRLASYTLTINAGSFETGGDGFTFGYFYGNTGAVYILNGGGSIAPTFTDWGFATLTVDWTGVNCAVGQNCKFDVNDDYYNLHAKVKVGDQIKIGADAANLDIRNDLWIQQGEVTNAGIINIGSGNMAPASSFGGDFVNDGSFLPGTSSVSFIGIAEQEIRGSAAKSSFYNLLINNSSSTGVVLNQDIEIKTAGTITLTDGYLYTSSSNILSILDGGLSSQGNSSSFVDGPMKKIGDDAFTFPLGDNGRWARVGISDPGVTLTDEYTAEYFNHDPTNDGYNNSNLTSPLTDVSSNQYWNISRTVTGSPSVSAILYSDDAASSGIDNCADLVVAHWNSGTSLWEDIGQSSISSTGCPTPSTQSLNITSTATTSFSPFAFGSKSSAVNPLPIELLDFTAYLDNDAVLVDWTTATEINNDYFTVERSTDGKEFSTVGTVKGAGNSSVTLDYEFIDINLPASVSRLQSSILFYRLKQTDFDGTSSYSDVAAVELRNKTGELYAFPNPANDRLSLVAGDMENPVVKIYDVTGQVVSETVICDQPGRICTIDIASFAQGVYFVSISDGHETRYARFVKEGQ